MSQKLGPAYSPDDYAGFLRRTAALILDALILYVGWLALGWGWYLMAPDVWVTEASYNYLSVVWFIGALLYLTGFRLTTRGTYGYRIVGIRYAPMLSGEPTRTQLAYRAVMAMFLMWFF
ncbi:MAG: RDD family protein, partial [bacterium]|nr:RDD family protein [bacterium]